MSSGASRYLFRCDCNDTVGYGHFSRSLSLARALRAVAPAARIAFWGDYNAFAFAALHRYGFERLARLPLGFGGRDLEGFRRACREWALVVVDGYEIDQAFVDAVKGDSFRFALFDDARSWNSEGVDVDICFLAGAEEFKSGARHPALGPRYFIARPELRELRLRNLDAPAPGPATRALVGLSGASVAPGLARAAVRAAAAACAQVEYVVAGDRAFEDAPANARLAAQRADFEVLLERCELVLSGGGLVKYEAAYCGIPNASISLTPLQHRDTKAMAARNLTLDLGSAGDFDGEAATAALARFAADADALAAMRAACAGAFDTDSTQRLARLLANP